MITQRLTFTRIFDLKRIPAARFNRKETLFGFEAVGVKKPGVCVSGWPRIEVGDEIVALLKKENNWQTLIGWKNITTGEIAGVGVRQEAFQFSRAFVLFALFTLMSSDGLEVHPMLRGAQVLFLFLSITSGIQLQRCIAWHRLLSKIA